MSDTTTIHGSLSRRERQGLGPELLDFAVNTSPYGPAPSLTEAVRRAAIDRYPDQHAESLRSQWASELQLSESEVVFANGGVELIWAAARAFLSAHRALIVIGPTFSEPEVAARAVGAQIHSCKPPLRAGETMLRRWSVQEIVDAVSSCPQEVGMVYLCSPNNPTGQVMSGAQLGEIVTAIAPARLLLDRSFETLRMDTSLSSSPGAARAWEPHAVMTPADLFGIRIQPGCLELRSFTKDFAVPGLRLGALFADALDAAACCAQLPPWNVSAHASAGAEAILMPESIAFMVKSRERWWRDAEQLAGAMSSRGLDWHAPTVPFGLLRTGQAAESRRALLEDGIHVRDCSSFGLPEHVRIAARPPQDQSRLLVALDRLVPLGGLHADGGPQNEDTQCGY